MTLFHRYLTGHPLPDKAVDLLDTVSARVDMSLETVPEHVMSTPAKSADPAGAEQATAGTYGSETETHSADSWLG